MKQACSLSLSVQYGVARVGVPTRSQFRRWVTSALQQNITCTIRIVGEEEGRMLNRDFRKKDYATNVLTFSYEDTKPLSGDIVICAPVVSAEADKQGKELLAHYAHLTVHGVLHLQGYDHETDSDAEKMESLETAIIVKMGYPPPYEVIPKA